MSIFKCLGRVCVRGILLCNIFLLQKQNDTSDSNFCLLKSKKYLDRAQKMFYTVDDFKVGEIARSGP